VTLNFLGIYGDLKLHGKAHNHVWVKLAETAFANSNTLYLEQGVDWSVGMEIVITTTSYEFGETEIHTIAEVLNNGATLITEESLHYVHLGMNTVTVVI